MTNNVA